MLVQLRQLNLLDDGGELLRGRAGRLFTFHKAVVVVEFTQYEVGELVEVQIAGSAAFGLCQGVVPSSIAFVVDVVYSDEGLKYV